MLYTIMPMEIVSANQYKDELKQNVQVVTVNGIMMEGVRDGAEFTVRRLLSSDPAAYINGTFYPGKKLKL